ncbi:glycoside hydrolase family 27 protein [Streptomyces sp. NA04227]|uniref:glycoside hydrolase family 27 protein n=1 Tax=Streptomyces sp. NA04227 TaxID=2742136 RepID=UPI0015911839|nr:glycoside hydrolase family 27 protein [Streptomyces sp. NA04227]QKW09202.1 glycoside hydrolase family 27 protein [Streptomyces sp. NA04227]
MSPHRSPQHRDAAQPAPTTGRAAPHRRWAVPIAALAVLATSTVTAVQVSATEAAEAAVSRTTAVTASVTKATDNGLGSTPQMGWNSWNAYHCDIDEDKIKAAADRVVALGLRDAGYEYINIDDCWQEPERDAEGALVADSERFPGGIKALADYVHARGLKLGIYATPGSRTCANIWDGYPGRLGSLGHEEQDARTFAAWGVDYLKYDWCRADEDGVEEQTAFTKMRHALDATGRPMLYSIHAEPELPVDPWRPDVAHSWRTTVDIRDTWASMLDNFKKSVPQAEFAGPGHWNDPDMLEVGNSGMTDTEYRSHFSLWAMMAAPMLVGTDLAKADAATVEILANKEVLAVDQDRLGKQGTVLASEKGGWILVRELADGDRAVALFNESGTARELTTTARAAGLPDADTYRLRDVWRHRTSVTKGRIGATVPAHGTVMFRVSAGS